MNFNTAIFYDIENLIGGYGNSDMLSNLSLKEIFDDIRKTCKGGIVMQRAYANWSDSRLSILRGDIIELGIEPVQMFGFGRGNAKNASDIQLVIDAVDSVFTKPYIDTYVIVSGDGGFSFLAKKLHEYGKQVVGCAYKRKTNKVFRAVSDEFIWIEEPRSDTGGGRSRRLPPPSATAALPTASSDRAKDNGSQAEPQQRGGSGSSSTRDANGFRHAVVQDFAAKYQPRGARSQKEITELAHDILNFIVEHPSAKRPLRSVGLNVSIFSQMINYRIRNFSYFRAGFTKLTDFLAHVCEDAPCNLVYRAPSDYRIVLNDAELDNYKVVKAQKAPAKVHTVATYREILRRGEPAIKMLDRDALYTVAEELAAQKSSFQRLPLADIIDRIDEQTDLSQSSIKGALLTYIAADCFKQEPPEARLSDQRLSARFNQIDAYTEAVNSAMRDQLTDVLGKINKRPFERMSL